MSAIPVRLRPWLSGHSTSLDESTASLWAPSRLWVSAAALSVLGLLTYPLASAWLGLGGALALALARWRLVGRPFAKSPLNVPLSVYLAGGVVGLAATLNPDTAGIRFFGLLAATIAFFLVVDIAATPTAARKLAVGALVVAILAMPLMLATVTRLQTHRLPDAIGDPLRHVGPALSPARSGIRDLDEYAADRYRLTPTGLAMMATFGLGLALGPVLAGATRRQRLLGVLAVGYFGLFLLISAKRAALVETAVVVLLLSAARWPRLLLGAAAIVGILLAAGLSSAGPMIAGAVSPLLKILPPAALDLGPGYVRLEFWQNSLFLLGDFQFTGVGLGPPSVRRAYETYFPQPEPIPAEDLSLGLRPYHFAHAHNAFLQSYLEQGLFGLVGLFALVGVAFVVGWQALAPDRLTDARWAAVAGGGGALACVLAGLTEIVPITSVGMVLFFGALGLVVAAHPSRRSAATKEVRRGSSLATLFQAALVLAVALIALLTAATLLPVIQPTSFGHLALPAAVRQPVSTLVARFTLNLGALELAKLERGAWDVSEGEHRRGVARATELLSLTRELEPSNPSVYRNLALASLAGSRRSTARGLLAQSEAITAPGDSQGLFQLGRLYREAGEVDRAIAVWSRVDCLIGAWSRSGPRLHLVAWGTELVEQRRWQAAIEVNRAAVAAVPVSRSSYRSLSTAISQLQGDEEALATMQQLAHLYPDIPWAYEEVERLQLRKQVPDAAAEWGRKASDVRQSGRWRSRLATRPLCQ